MNQPKNITIAPARGAKTSFKERLEKLRKENEAPQEDGAQKIVADHIRRCAKVVGTSKRLAEIVGTSPAQLRKWKSGTRMKANTAMHFEVSLNAWLDAQPVGPFKTMFRCDRKKLIAWFFVSGVTK